MLPPLLHPIFFFGGGEFPSDEIARVAVSVSVSGYLKLFSRAIVFEVFQPV